MTATASESSAPAPPAPDIPAPSPHARRDLFLISFLILFFELACIRWFGSTVVFLTFFTNIVLIACFLGMSVGCLAASRRFNLFQTVIPLTLLSVGLAWAVLLTYEHNLRLTIDVGSQASPQQIYFGTEYRPKTHWQYVVPLEVVAGVFFVLIAMVFVGLGQVMGRAFDTLPNRVAAYTINIVGSLVGIVAFAACSFLSLPPLVWFLVCAPILVYFLPRTGNGSRRVPGAESAKPRSMPADAPDEPGLRRLSPSHPAGNRAGWSRPLQLAALGAVLVIVGLSSFGVFERDDQGRRGAIHWSPYYKIRFTKENGEIFTNNITHQYALEVRKWGPAYALPHLLNRDAGGQSFQDVMIIGAGSGNDVQAALSFGAKHIDAVEIDPVIYHLGRKHHPDRPYDDPRVAIQLDDGRSFARRTDRKYDLVEYALVDSLVLHSAYSSLRLESFLFTKEAFQDVKNTLKDDGVFIMYNYYRQWWVVGRLAQMAEQVFGARPLVISLPYREEIGPAEDAPLDARGKRPEYFTLLIAGKPNSPTVERIRRAFEQHGRFWLNTEPAQHEVRSGQSALNGYRRAAPAAATQSAFPTLKATDPGAGRTDENARTWQEIGLAKVITEVPRRDALRGAPVDYLPSDNWPFLYTREPAIPNLSLRGIVMMAVLSLVILVAFAPVRTVKPNGQMFFLGAGFMLLETKGVVHLALLMGSTWVVNSVVFFAILVLILLANLYVLKVKPTKLWPYYALLAAALLVNALVPMNWFLSLPGAGRMVASCLVVFVPIFFAGIIFSTTFRDSKQPDVDFGSNIGGVILGGLTEYLSVALGFNYLVLVALGYYALSALRLRPNLAGKVEAA